MYSKVVPGHCYCIFNFISFVWQLMFIWGFDSLFWLQRH